jgi:hypothetical protein
MKYDKYTEVVVTYGFSAYDFKRSGPLGIKSPIPGLTIYSQHFILTSTQQ